MASLLASVLFGKSAALKSVELSKLSVITWNVWFDSLARNDRYDYILNTCQTLSPDVICFQEVTPYFIDILRKHPLVEMYSSSDEQLTGDTIRPYGVLTLCRTVLGTVRYKFVDFPTDMNRKLLVAELSSLKGGVIGIGNVHLESLNSQSKRAKQLQISFSSLKQYNAAILCGDFNFCSYRNYAGSDPLENDSLGAIMPNYLDVWPTVREPTDMGYTFDTVANGMLQEHRHEQMRYDRIMLRAPATSDNSLKPLSIHLIGTQSIDGSSESGGTTAVGDNTNNGFTTPEKKATPIFASDHFGLHSVISINGE
eukprot:CAMPEP_0175011672 /NCGR_PEP_ID=MMETSP0005-20121125/8829_1 /TAXON_ID=420556 /ORGANISM="Ochromonas sp., Strain CCMP1393" /LENGTH=310 /DNA_ID=CAMNT_0016267715 /DNA_START=28 /DNA_END=960 /DNA_ORIENTATION=+